MIIDCCKKRTSKEEYLMGGQRMNAVAVGFSLSASLMNAIFIIGRSSVFHFYTKSCSRCLVSVSIVIILPVDMKYHFHLDLCVLLLYPFYSESIIGG